MTEAAHSTPTPLYLRIAEDVSRQVATGALRDGDRVPSLRQLSRQMRVSMTTALQAYLWLENRGYLESKPQSGFYVRKPFATLIPEPLYDARKSEPAEITTDTVLSDVIESANKPSNISFGVASAHPDLFPSRKLNLILRSILRENPNHSARYDFGAEPLRRQIARRTLAMGCGLSARDVTVTSGALEAINLGLRVKKLQSTFARQAEVVRNAIARYFPEGTRISRPAGGHMLWVELPPRVNAMKLYRAALNEHIAILPGPLFSATGRYQHHIRINSGSGWSPEHERALVTLGRLCDRVR